jgi:hypothetical protein
MVMAYSTPKCHQQKNALHRSLRGAECEVYVPELDGLITLLTLDGQVLTRWTSPTTTGAGDGGHAVWIDSHGDIYINQNQEGRRLLKYRRCGDVAGRHGVRGA